MCGNHATLGKHSGPGHNKEVEEWRERQGGGWGSQKEEGGKKEGTVKFYWDTNAIYGRQIIARGIGAERRGRHADLRGGITIWGSARSHGTDLIGGK